MTDLNTLIAAKTGWELSEADRINAKGQILGIGSYKNAYHNSEYHYFPLTPK